MSRTAMGAGALVVGILMVAGILVLRTLTYMPFLPDDSTVVNDPASLPNGLSVCGRGWSKDHLDRQLSAEQIVSESGQSPIVVSPRPFAACPAGACTAVAGGSCATVIFARVGPDLLVGYSLKGGP